MGEGVTPYGHAIYTFFMNSIIKLTVQALQCLGSGSVGSARFWLDPDPDLQKYVDPRIRIQGEKYQPKTATTKKFNSQNPNLNY